jgi:peptidoglycan hydrolase-like protein with peptidoglycan-binding domain
LKFVSNQPARAYNAPHNKGKKKMKKLITVALSLLFVSSLAFATQNTNSSSTASPNAAAKKKRGPVFRATKDQIKQAQGLLKGRGFYSGEQSGKLDADTRAGLKKYQAAEGIKVTGTLNRVTLEKMNVTLTDKQRAM